MRPLSAAAAPNNPQHLALAPGGTPRALTALDAARHEVAHDSAVVLPGGRLVLFASQTTRATIDSSTINDLEPNPR